MDTRRLEAFAAVARERSFTRAALSLHVSQSGLSQQIAALERELDARLFDRTRRRVALTPAGEALLGWAERLLGDAEGARRAVTVAQGRIGGVLRIAASRTISGYVLPRALAALVAQHPDVRPSVTAENTERVVQLLIAGAVDVGFVEGDAHGVDLRPFHRDELVVIAPPTHRFRAFEEVPPAELAHEPFVAREPGSGTRQIAETALVDIGVPALRVVAELSGIEAIKGSVEAGLGVSIVSALTVRRELHAGVLIARPVARASLRRDLAAASAPGQPVLPAALALELLLGDPGLHFPATWRRSSAG